MSWRPYDPCPGGCGVIGWKLRRNGRVVGCKCPSEQARSNRREGRRGEGRRHKRLSSPYGPVDESAYGYAIRVSTQDKVGKQVPALFGRVMDSVFFTRAMKQASDKIPVGSGTFPAVYVEIDPNRAYLVVDVSGKGWR